MEFYEKLLAQCSRHRISPSRAASKIGLSNSAASGWKHGKQPSDVTIAKLAELFGVEKDYFAGEKEKSPSAEPANGEETAFLQLFRALTDAEKQSITDQMSWLIERRE